MVTKISYTTHIKALEELIYLIPIPANPRWLFALQESIKILKNKINFTDVDWEPIESATGNKEVLGFQKETGDIYIVRLKNGKPFIVGDTFYLDASPITHWANFPAPPDLTQEVEDGISFILTPKE